LRRKLICLECREENRPFSGQQHQAQFGLNPALTAGQRRRSVCKSGVFLHFPPCHPLSLFLPSRGPRPLNTAKGLGSGGAVTWVLQRIRAKPECPTRRQTLYAALWTEDHAFCDTKSTTCFCHNWNSQVGLKVLWELLIIWLNVGCPTVTGQDTSWRNIGVSTAAHQDTPIVACAAGQTNIA